MRVLLTADTLGGVWTYTVELTRALSDVEFVVASMGAMPTDAQRAELPDNVDLAASSFRLEWMDEPWDDVASAGYWLLDLEAEHKPDVVHLNGYTHAALPFKAPKLVVAHSCVLSWWRAVKGEDAPPEWSRYRLNVENGLRAADLVIAPSAAMLHAVDELYRFDTPRGVIHNGRRCPLPLAGEGGAKRRVRAPSSGLRPPSPPLSQGRRLIFAAGRLWDEAKNLRAVVDAACTIRWPVHIAGDGGAAAEHVKHHGRLDAEAMQRCYGAAGIYLFPALYEPFGLSILEAGLAGCALVLGDIASLREIWGDAAVYVPPRDPAAIAGAVNELIADPARRRDMAQRAAERAKTYTAEAMALAYRKTYEELSRPGRTRHSSPVTRHPAPEARA